MTRKQLADAFNLLAEAAVKVAIELEAVDAEAQPARPAGAAESTPPSAPAALDISECPKHHVAWEPGQYGPYCKQPTDDAAWGKQKGDRMWCRITPKNAPDYLRVQAA